MFGAIIKTEQLLLLCKFKKQYNKLLMLSINLMITANYRNEILLMFEVLIINSLNCSGIMQGLFYYCKVHLTMIK